MSRKLRISLLFVLCVGILASSVHAFAKGPIVHVVLFYSPTCPHCQKVIEEELPQIVQKYGSQLDIVGIDVSNEIGLALYQAAVSQYNIPDDRIGVPTLVVGDQILVGSVEIPEQLPGLVEKGLQSGGIDFPNISGLKEVLDRQPAPAQDQMTSQTTTQQPAPGGPTFLYNFMQDPLANSIAVIVLVGMIASVIGTAASFIKGNPSRFLAWPNWVVPVLAILGMCVAGYLSYVEVTKTDAICGPVGNCNSVQESPYAYLFGVIPVGALGLVGYCLILAAWIFKQFGPQSIKKFFAVAIWGMAWFGALFTIYLTFLEPFVIGATCAWCITSAIIMTLILLGSTEPAKQALRTPDEEMDVEFFEELEGEDDQADSNPNTAEAA